MRLSANKVRTWVALGPTPSHFCMSWGQSGGTFSRLAGMPNTLRRLCHSFAPEPPPPKSRPRAVWLAPAARPLQQLPGVCTLQPCISLLPSNRCSRETAVPFGDNPFGWTGSGSWDSAAAAPQRVTCSCLCLRAAATPSKEALSPCHGDGLWAVSRLTPPPIPGRPGVLRPSDAMFDHHAPI